MTRPIHTYSLVCVTGLIHVWAVTQSYVCHIHMRDVTPHPNLTPERAPAIVCDISIRLTYVLQNIVSFIGLFCRRNLQFETAY